MTGRRVWIEYALIRDVNDQPWRADLVAKRLRERLNRLVYVNVIRSTLGGEWDASPKPVEREPSSEVMLEAMTCTVRDTGGRRLPDADAALAHLHAGVPQLWP